MLKVNPATAKFMLDHYVDLKQGDCVVQNAGNSAVGRYLIQLAKAKGVQSINIVRREGLEKELTKLGADWVLVEGEDIPEKVRAELGDANIPLAIDAVAGKTTLSLGGILSEEGCRQLWTPERRSVSIDCGHGNFQRNHTDWFLACQNLRGDDCRSETTALQ